jgi:hypothetical protein
MAKAKRTTQAEATTTRPTLAGLQAQVDDLKTRLDVASGIDVHHAGVLDEVKAKLDQLESQLKSLLSLYDDLSQDSRENGEVVESFKTVLRSNAQDLDSFREKRAQLETQLAQSIATQSKINTELQGDSDAVENKLDLLRQTVEKFGGENGQIAQALAEIKSTKSGGGWLNWAPVGVIAIAIAILVGVQRGCNQVSPKPAPDEFEQSIIEPSKAKKLAGSVIMLIDRDPMTDDVLNLETAAEAYKLEHEGFEFRTYDYQDDKSAKVANYVNKAKEKGVDPPLMIHLLDGKVSFAPAAKDWAGVVKAFGK